MTCDHKFIDSNRCLKCGWAAPDVDCLNDPNVPRAIVVGSKWLDRSALGPSHNVEVTHLHEDGGGLNLIKDAGWRFSMTTIAFRHAYKWVSDPDPTAAKED